jgi:ADP-heptose:LPS heptosyltransferase
LVGWGPAEREEALALAAEIPGAIPIPPTTIPELALLLQRADLYVGMDTGPMHVAALLGTPTVGVFGRSDPQIHGPAAHLPGRAVAGPEAREWKTRSRRGLPPFVDPQPAAVVEAALELLTGARPADASPRESTSPTADR